MKKLIIEVAVNEYVNREQHPDVPLSAAEIATQASECAEAGASIIHFHPRTTDPEQPVDYLAEDVDSYREIMEAIAEQCDVITYPTYSGYGYTDPEVPIFPHVRELRTKGPMPLETFVPFVGAINHGRWSREKGAWVSDNVIGISHTAMTEFLTWCRESGLHPQFGVREIGHLRHIAAYREQGLIDGPVVLHLTLLPPLGSPGPPPDAKGIMSLLSYVPAEWNAEWFVQNNHDAFSADLTDEEHHRRLNVLAICMGGHVRTGIGDLPSWGAPPLRNVDMVRKMVRVAETIGRDIATPDEARKMMGLT